MGKPYILYIEVGWSNGQLSPTYEKHHQHKHTYTVMVLDDEEKEFLGMCMCMHVNSRGLSTYIEVAIRPQTNKSRNFKTFDNRMMHFSTIESKLYLFVS